MNAEDRALADVAATVADGGAVDWTAAGGRMPERQRRLIRHLQLVDNIARVHRTLAVDVDERDEAAAAETGAVRRWGPFVLLERIGEGVTGEVYRAWDSQLHRDVALKLLRPDAYRRDTARERVLDEARRLARIRHEHVVQVYGAESHGGRVGLWMELLRGESLDRVVRARGPLEPVEVVHYGRHLCAALSAVHAAGLLHRDVKAQNVIVDKAGRTVLMDLGTGEELRRSAGTNRLVGTPLYLAPEVFKGEPATVQSDVYSLGVLLFHLVTGQFPVSATSLKELAQAHKEGRRHRVLETRTDLPPALVQAIEGAIEPLPARRFRTASELETALADSEAAAVPPRVWRRSFAAVTAALAAAVLALIVWSGALAGEPANTVKTVAVAPMTAIDPAATPTYLAEGLTDQLVATLGQIKSLRVIPARQTETILARGLGDATADAVLETRLLVVGSRVRVTAHMTPAGGGPLLWSDIFEEDLGDTFAFQAVIARKIAASLNAAVTREEQARLRRPRGTTEDAEKAFLEGRALIEGYGVEYTQQALRAFRSAIAADPQHAAAHAGAARALLTLGFRNELSQAEARAGAEAHAQQALALDDTLPDAHTALADIAFYSDWDWQRAEAGYTRSLVLNASDARARLQYADLLAATGRTREGVEQTARVIEILPGSADAYREHAILLYYDRQFEEASRAVRKSLEFEQNAPGAWTILGRIAEAEGRLEEARQHTDRAADLARGRGVPALLQVQQMRLQALTGDSAGALTALARLRREAESRLSSWNPHFEASLRLAMGELELGLALLEEAVQQRQPSVLWLAVDPRMDDVREHPRFQRILRQLGLQ